MKTMQIIETLAKTNPEAINNPRAQSLLDIIRSGDEKRGIEAANNILNDMGIQRDAGVQQATNGLMAMMQGRFRR